MHRLRLAHDRPAYAALRAGTRCVCCSADACGRRAPYHDPSLPMFSVPVCAACTDHALGSSDEWIGQLVLVALGVVALVFDVMLGGPGLIGSIGGLFLVSAAVWRAADRVQLARTRRRGHHPGLGFEIGPGYTTITTSNVRLVDDLMALHPNAHVCRADDLPAARAVRMPS